MNNYDELSKLDCSLIPPFSFNGTIAIARICDVYDGDTVTIVFRHNGGYVKYKLRLTGFDTPEIKPTRDTPERDLHVSAGKKVREYLRELILNKLVHIEFDHEDKYGRLMGKIYLLDQNLEPLKKSVNQILIERGYGKIYTGGRKEVFDKCHLLKILSN